MKIRQAKEQILLRVDLSSGSIKKEPIPEEWTEMYLGARGINSRLLLKEIKNGIDPYGPENILYIGTGPMDGVPIGMGRLSIATKSPRGCIAEGSSGGFFGPELRRAGYDFIAVEGISEKPVYLLIQDEKVEIKDASHLWGKTTYETDAALREELKDPNFQFRYIGPAAENLVHSAMLFGNLNQAGGRAGCGEIMGSKKLKALAVRGHGGIKLYDYEGFLDAYKDFRQKLDLETSRDMWTPVWSTFGAPVLSRLFPDMGQLMTRNAQEMTWDYDKATAISSEKYLDSYVTKAKACWCCPWPSCQKLYTIPSGKYQGFKGGNYWAGQPITFGSLIDNGDLDLLLVLSGLCNRYGLDIFHVGYTLGWAMECFEKGILTKADTEGMELGFGRFDQDELINLVRKIAYKEGFGELLSLGCEGAAQRIGKGSDKFCLSVKGMELEAIAERNLLMVGLGIAVSEVGPDHTRWYPPYPCNPSLLSKAELDELGLDIDLKLAFETRNPDKKGELLRWFTISRAIVEALPSCVFLVRDSLGLDLRTWWKLFESATGIKQDYQEFVRAGERIMNLDRIFNVREGYGRKDDRVPYRMSHEDVKGFGYKKIDQDTLDTMLDEYYSANGWSLSTTVPKRSKLSELGMEELAEDLVSKGVEVES